MNISASFESGLIAFKEVTFFFPNLGLRFLLHLISQVSDDSETELPISLVEKTVKIGLSFDSLCFFPVSQFFALPTLDSLDERVRAVAAAYDFAPDYEVLATFIAELVISSRPMSAALTLSVFESFAFTNELLWLGNWDLISIIESKMLSSTSFLLDLSSLTSCRAD